MGASSLNMRGKVMEPPPRVGRAAPLVDASDDLSKYDQPAASSVGGRKVQGFDGRFEGGGGLHVLVGIRVFLDLAGQNTG